MRGILRRSSTAAAVITWTMTGTSASAFAADPEGVMSLDDGPKFAIGLATAAFLIVLLLLLRLARARAGSSAAAGAPEADSPAAAPGPASPEAEIPRWRRPSVVAARYGLSAGAQRSGRQAFEPAEAPTADRLVVRYDAVPLVEEPDDVHGRTIDELSAGDEVEVVDRQSLWIHVRTPAGRVGWVPAMTLATLEELPPEVWATPVEELVPPPIDPGPPLEVLLEAIAAERRNGGHGQHHQEVLASEPAAAAAATSEATAPAAATAAASEEAAPAAKATRARRAKAATTGPPDPTPATAGGPAPTSTPPRSSTRRKAPARGT